MAPFGDAIAPGIAVAQGIGRLGNCIELLRVDHANHVPGLRLNTWTSIIVCVAALAYLWRTRTLTREDPAALCGPAATTPPEPEARVELPTVEVESRMTSSKEPGGG